MTQIHFAGMNTALLAEALEGHPVLISYADIIRRPGVWENEILPRLLTNRYPSVILDSGAFTELTTPDFHVDVQEYGRFIKRHRDLFDVVVNLDDIGGDVDRSQNNLLTLEQMTGCEIMPVFHGREDWKVLEEMLDSGHDHIGVGFAREASGRIASDQGAGRNPDEFLAELFARCEGRATIHGFGMTRYSAQYPFQTVDSTSWIAEYRAIRKELEPGQKGHGCTGRLAQLIARLSPQQQLRLVLDSYTAAGGEPDADSVEESFWQARTVIRRYDAAELTDKIGFYIVSTEDDKFKVIDNATKREIAEMWTIDAAIAVVEDQLIVDPRPCPHN